MTVTVHTPKMLFPLGDVVSTPGGIEKATISEMVRCLARHAAGDWDATCEEDRQANDYAVKYDNRILSAWPIDPALPCNGWGDNCFWSTTEADRSVTTLLLPDEY